MTTGVVFFAFNNLQIDYVKIAEWNAKNVQKFLNLPVTLITNSSASLMHCFDQVIYVDLPTQTNQRFFKDFKKTDEWHNYNRNDVFALSPYDVTILLDVDYVVASDQLLLLCEDPRDFVCHTTSTNLTDQMSDSTFGLYQMPMAWATVVKFTKSSSAGLIFDLIKMIKSNYPHYANLYGFSSQEYRNDYALSIALNIASGHHVSQIAPQFSIAWPLVNVSPECNIKINDRGFEVEYHKQIDGNYKPFKLSTVDLDLHVIGKKHLETAIASAR